MQNQLYLDFFQQTCNRKLKLCSHLAHFCIRWEILGRRIIISSWSQGYLVVIAWQANDSIAPVRPSWSSLYCRITEHTRWILIQMLFATRANQKLNIWIICSTSSRIIRANCSSIAPIMTAMCMLTLWRKVRCCRRFFAPHTQNAAGEFWAPGTAPPSTYAATNQWRMEPRVRWSFSVDEDAAPWRLRWRDLYTQVVLRLCSIMCISIRGFFACRYAW